MGKSYLRRSPILMVLVVVFVMISCNRHSVKVKDRTMGDIIENVSDYITPFDSDSASVGTWSDIMSAGQWVFVIDGNSPDSVITVFDAESMKWIGNIAKVGPGPDEATVPGAVVFDDETDRLLIFDYGQLKVKAFNVDSALNVSYYQPTPVLDIPTGRFPDRYIHVNDTLGFARLIIMPDRNSRQGGFEQALCRYNMTTGELTEFSDISARMKGLKTLFDINPNRKRLVECATNNDLITIYDFDGNKLREIMGPEYQADEPVQRKRFFSQPVVTNDYILALYSGSDDRDTKIYARYIHVYDMEGDYIKTLDAGKLIGHIGYDEQRGRLLIVFNDPDIQLGYIDMKQVL